MRHEPVAPRASLRGLAAVARRFHLVHALHSAAAGALTAAVVLTIARLSGASSVVVGFTAGLAGILTTAASLAASRHSRSEAAAARAVERSRAECRNVVITAEELHRHPERAEPWVRQRVIADAERHLAALPPTSVVPVRRGGAAAALGLTVLIAVVTNAPARITNVASQVGEQIGRAVRGSASGGTLVATIEPPAHTRLPRRHLTDPAVIEAVEGSRLHLRIRGAWRLRFGTAALGASGSDGNTTASTILRESGYFAIEPAEGGSTQGPRLVPVTVTPDRAPVVRVEKPGRDLRLPDSTSAIRVEASAADDFALAALSLRYTRVSGTGEQFEFVEGEMPVNLSRADQKKWQVTGTFALPELGLEPGDSLVYRVIARDGRPGDAGLATSDTFFIEIAGPGQVPLEGFEMPPDRDRYALSQQMIVLKIQRLRARERGLAKEALTDGTAAIAAEQRAVRANFIFLMGGHVEDEEAEAAHENEIQEGRLENTARREISRAVSYMTFAERALSAIDTSLALEQAKLAVDALQRAFGRNRYLLRTLPVRSRVDPSRRLSGRTDDARDWERVLAVPLGNREADAARGMLAGILDAAPAVLREDPGVAVPQLTRLAEEALQVNPADLAWQQVSASLLGLRDALTSKRSRNEVERLLREAVNATVVQVRRQMPDVLVTSPPAGRLRSAWADALRSR